MVSGGVHLQYGVSNGAGDAEKRSYRAEAVNTSRKTFGQISGKNTTLIRVVQALEEGKHLRIGDLNAVDGGDLLDSNMAVL